MVARRVLSEIRKRCSSERQSRVTRVTGARWVISKTYKAQPPCPLWIREGKEYLPEVSYPPKAEKDEAGARAPTGNVELRHLDGRIEPVSSPFFTLDEKHTLTYDDEYSAEWITEER